MRFVGSEVDRLRRVVVKPPGLALSRMLPQHIHPGSEHYLLFDDLVDVPSAQEEHAQLCAVLATAAEVGNLDEMILPNLLWGTKIKLSPGENLSTTAFPEFRCHQLLESQYGILWSFFFAHVITPSFSLVT